MKINPFRPSVPKSPPEERPMPPCGMPGVHYAWTNAHGPVRSCPLCAGNEVRARKRVEEDDYINRLAKAIARELKEIL